ncbi:MAG: transcriptional regulator [Acidimicrobiia bacterium]|nr:transcriptional regulator [Acidimicrobiia bacterium]
MVRSTSQRLENDAVAALVEALEELGLSAEGTRRREPADVVLRLGEGEAVAVEVKAGASPTPGQIERAVGASRRGRADACVYVADRLSAAARRELDAAGWGWLDRRGHLKLQVPDRAVVIDADVPAVARRGAKARGRSGVRGRSGLAYAAAALLRSDEAPSVRRVAAWAGLAPSSVSEAKQALEMASLVRGDGRALVPELFWAVAEVWGPEVVPVARSPLPDVGGVGRLDLTLDDPAAPGWALTDTLAAAAWGAPVVAPGGYPPDFYLPGSESLRRAVVVLGEASSFEERGATVAVAPLPAVTVPRYDRGVEWLVAHPLFVAFDLARDPSRGREILDGWEPDEPGGFRRVW